MLQIKHLHSVDKMWTGVEVVGPRLLQATQAKDTAFSHGTASKGPAARQAWVPGPGPGLQIKSFKSSHWELALAAPCQWNWDTSGGSPGDSVGSSFTKLQICLLQPPTHSYVHICMWIIHHTMLWHWGLVFQPQQGHQ